MDSFNDLHRNGQQMPQQMNNDLNPRQRPDIYMTEQMSGSGLRAQYNSPSIEGQLRRPNTSINSSNTLINDSINDLSKQTNLLSFRENVGPNDNNNYNNIGGAGDLTNNTLSWIPSELKGQSSQSCQLSGPLRAPPMESKLSPFAKEFVPRTTMSFSNSSSVMNGVSWSPMRETGPPVARDLDDFIALSYLREFIDTITIKPNKYDSGIAYLTEVINSYIDEDESVMQTIVNTVVDQAIVDPQFRYNGVRLCIYFMDNLMALSEDKTFKLLLFKRCQREHFRRDRMMTSSDDSENYLRGFTMFIGDLYSRSSAPELAEYLPQLLLTLLSKPHKENLKCVCQVLKLCGSLLERYYTEKRSEDMNKVMEELKVCLNNNDISVYVKELITNIIEMQKRGWTANMPSTATPVVNPYLNMNFAENVSTNASDCYEEYNSYSDEEDFHTSYDFGQCGDEEDNEVCEAFEEFLKNSGQTK